MTSKDTIRSWFEAGHGRGATHMAVFWDLFDGSEGDYPVYYAANNEQELRKDIRSNDDRLMEVYSYAVPIEDQIDLYRAMNFTCAPAPAPAPQQLRLIQGGKS